jgi:hypothetical protein
LDLGPNEQHEIDLWDRTNERAVLNLVPGQVQQAFINASQREPEIFGIDERDLFKRLRSTGRTPSPTDNRLRMAFWYEYDQAQLTLKPMEMKRVYAGVCSDAYFYQRYLGVPHRVAWMLTPVTDYVTKTKEALDFGLDRIREILEREPVNHKGQFDSRLAELQVKITWMLEQRVKGAVVQRAEVKTMGLNIHTTDKQVGQAMIENSMESMEKRLKELEREERKAMSLPPGDKGPKPQTVEVVADIDDGS